jgi:hypothetical protein
MALPASGRMGINQINLNIEPYFSVCSKFFSLGSISQNICEPFETLTRISHQPSTAAADPGMSTALRSVGLLDVLSSTSAGPLGRASCIHARLHRLATKPGEKCGLMPRWEEGLVNTMPRNMSIPKAESAAMQAERYRIKACSKIPVNYSTDEWLFASRSRRSRSR